MDDMSKARVVVVISFFLAIVLFIKLCLFGYSGKRKFVNKAFKEGNYTKARIVKKNVYTGNDKVGSVNNFSSYKTKYEYIVNGKKYYKTYNFNTRTYFTSGPPDTINIYYDKNKPEKAVSGVEVNDGPRASGCYLTIVVVIVFAVVLYNIIKLL